MKNKKQGFVTFIGNASTGRIWGAVLCWIAAVLLVALMFAPFVNVDITEKTQVKEQPNVEQPIDESAQDREITQAKVEDVKYKIAAITNDSETQSGLQKFLYDTDKSESTEDKVERTNGKHDASMVDYLLSGYGGAGNIVLLIVYCVLIVTAIVCSLFTMNVVSLGAVLIAILEAVLIRLVKISNLVTVFNSVTAKDSLGNDVATNIQCDIVMSRVAIALLVIAAILAVVGVVLTYVLPNKKKDYEDEDMGWTETSYGSSEDTTGLYVVAKLVQLNTGKTFELMDNNEVVIGKNQQDADVIIQNSVVSRKHAKLVCKNGTFTLVDLNALNGTYVNDEKLAPGGSKQLYGGEYITLGNEILQFVV